MILWFDYIRLLLLCDCVHLFDCDVYLIVVIWYINYIKLLFLIFMYNYSLLFDDLWFDYDLNIIVLCWCFLVTVCRLMRLLLFVCWFVDWWYYYWLVFKYLYIYYYYYIMFMILVVLLCDCAYLMIVWCCVVVCVRGGWQSFHSISLSCIGVGRT